MILSRIIHHLRSQNWTAIGLEFLIVILGVVIGFQVTAWNETRHERALEHRYIERITVALESDIAEFEDAAHLAADRAAQVRLILEAAGSTSAVIEEPTPFLRSIITASFTYTATVDRIAFDEMIAVGDVAIIRSETVRARIAEYYQSAASVSQWNYLRENVQTTYQERRAGILKPAQERLWQDPNPPEPFTAADVDEALTRMRARPDYVEWLPIVEAWQVYIQSSAEEAVAEGEALHDLLTAELERLQ
ncbi:hypothetical protein [uncultured Maricaulis sp.]|mgnify:CR=1 FL=1|uniref:hypothetical protein n=1 Tax=uncultured Maricaulis sp. TaxID=174710 RepID=UPI0030DB8A9D|tara:strand:- start:8169 stop:8915 length:747 start_codon:yes stop_codon:yes gene_type:complete